mgnify:CR=1 FL=1
MATLQSAIEAIQDKVLTVAGVKNAPDSPSGVTGGSYPFVLTVSDGGVWEFGVAGEKLGLHNIRVEMHFPVKGLSWTVSKVMAYSDSIPNVLMKDPTLGGTVSTYGRIVYEFGPLGYMGIDTIGFAWTLEDVKMRSNAS